MTILKDWQQIALKTEIKYNPMTDFILAMDLLSKPEHHPMHKEWTKDVLNSLSRRDKSKLNETSKLFNSYLNLDEYLKDFNAKDGLSLDSFSIFLKNRDNWLKCDFEIPVSFLSYMWETYIKNIVEDHKEIILDQIFKGKEQLNNGEFKYLLSSINERIKINSQNCIQIDKWLDLHLEETEINKFIIEPTLFAFPHLAMNWIPQNGYFFLAWDVPFRGDDKTAKTIDLVSKKAFALSDKSRLRILIMLSNKPMTQKQIAKEMGFAKSTTSRHINILIDSGILRSSEYERNSLLYINRDVIEKISLETLQLFNF